MTERQSFPWASHDDWLANPAEARDHNHAAWHATSRGIARKVSRGADATLHPGGNVDPGPTPDELRARFRAALEDVRRRRLSAAAPDGWPVLSLTQESQVCRIVAQLQGAKGTVELGPDDARQVAHLLTVLQLLARAEWAEATLPVGPLSIQDNEPQG